MPFPNSESVVTSRHRARFQGVGALKNLSCRNYSRLDTNRGVSSYHPASNSMAGDLSRLPRDLDAPASFGKVADRYSCLRTTLKSHRQPTPESEVVSYADDSAVP